MNNFSSNDSMGTTFSLLKRHDLLLVPADSSHESRKAVLRTFMLGLNEVQSAC